MMRWLHNEISEHDRNVSFLLPSLRQSLKILLSFSLAWKIEVVLFIGQLIQTFQKLPVGLKNRVYYGNAFTCVQGLLNFDVNKMICLYKKCHWRTFFIILFGWQFKDFNKPVNKTLYTFNDSNMIIFCVIDDDHIKCSWILQK